MPESIRVFFVAGVLVAGAWSGGCIGSCDLYQEVKPLGRAFEIHRVDMDYLYRRSDAAEHERFVTRFDRIGVTEHLVVVFENEVGGCPGGQPGPCGRWWVGDLTTGETQGPLTSEQFEELKQLRPEVGQVRVGSVDLLWDSL